MRLSLEEYRQVYAYTWSRPPFRKLLQKIPAYMTLNDHEVDDDWTWANIARSQASIPIWDSLICRRHGRPQAECQITPQRVKDALQAYWEHQGMHARGYFLPLALDDDYRYTLAPDDLGSLAYSFDYGAAAFFVLDTRTMRVKPKGGQKKMLGEGQWQDLTEWLDKVKDTHSLKFIVTSCAMLYQLRFDIPKDRWTGFEEERRQFIEAIGQRTAGRFPVGRRFTLCARHASRNSWTVRADPAVGVLCHAFRTGAQSNGPLSLAAQTAAW